MGELQPLSAEGVVQALYGKEVFLFSLLSMAAIYWKEKRGERKDFIYIMFFWFLFMGLASLRSVRFVMYLVVPLGFFLGGAFSILIPKIFEKFTFNIKVKLFAIITLGLVYFFLLRSFYFTGIRTASNIYPFMNDSWSRVLTYVKENTSQEAILNSWWDYGNLFKAIGERRVIVDGQSQHRPLSYWMARILLSKNEKEALRILRMLNNASDTTFQLLNKYISDPFKCFAVLERLLSSGKDEGRRFLKEEKVPPKIVDKIIDDLYKKPSPAYFIVERTMIGKMGNISFLGNWDFVKLYIYRNIDKPKDKVLDSLREVFELSSQEAQRYYQEVVLTPTGKPLYESLSKRYYFFGPLGEGTPNGVFVYFDNGVVYDYEAKQALIYSADDKRYKIPRVISFIEGNKEEKIDIEDGDFDRGILLLKTEDKYRSIILDPFLIDTLFTRLYFLKGNGLKYFEPFFCG